MAAPRKTKKTEPMEISAAPVTDPFDDFVDPTTEATNTPLSEQETMPEYFTYFESSRVVMAAYDRDSKRLYMKFVKPRPEGTRWIYEGVPPNIWRNLLRAKSAGKFVNRNLTGANRGRLGTWDEYG
jgi:hypothetical protein